MKPAGVVLKSGVYVPKRCRTLHSYPHTLPPYSRHLNSQHTYRSLNSLKVIRRFV